MTQQDLVLDIAMNLTRIGNWALDDFSGKKKRIDQFLASTSTAVKSLAIDSPAFQKTLQRFLLDYARLTDEYAKGTIELSAWGEWMLTWGTILTHRAKLLS